MFFFLKIIHHSFWHSKLYYNSDILNKLASMYWPIKCMALCQIKQIFHYLERTFCPKTCIKYHNDSKVCDIGSPNIAGIKMIVSNSLSTVAYLTEKPCMNLPQWYWLSGH